MQLPTTREIELLHKKHAPSQEVFDEVWQHCQIVQEIAVKIIGSNNLTNIHRKLVEAGCLLHDLGVYRLYDSIGQIDDKNYIRHGVLGYEMLKEEGFSEILCRFASHHTGVGLTAQEIEENNLPLPKEDMLADTEEERIVMYADKFHSKLPSIFNSSDWYKQHLRRFGNHKVRVFEQMIADLGEPDIKSLAESYNQSYR